MRRWAFHILAGFSLLLGVAAAGMWVRSYSRAECMAYTSYEFREAPRIHTLATSVRLVSCLGGAQLGYFTSVIGGDQFEKSRQDPEYYQIGLRWLEFTGGKLRYPVQGRVASEWTRWTWWGFQFSKGKAGPADNPNTSFSVTLPYWFVILAGLSLPVFRAITIARGRRKIKDGLCIHCGYDLRASHERCPECGNPIRQPIVNQQLQNDEENNCAPESSLGNS